MTAWIVVPLSQTSSTISTRLPRSSGSAGNWKNVGRRAGLAGVVVVLDGGDEDVAQPESVGQHAGRHHPAARDRQHDVELLTGEPLGEERRRAGRGPPS